MARTPSHFISNAQPSSSPNFSAVVGVASIGSITLGELDRLDPARSGASGRVVPPSRSSGSVAIRCISQFFSGWELPPPVWIRANLRTPPSPPSGRPNKVTITSLPSRHLCSLYVPASQIVTSPPPYSPLGMVPSKLPYSSG